jgi:hypothetical protein
VIRGSVCLPVFNSVKIAWLCLESLCRQHKPKNNFELIIFEEAQPNQLGKSFFLGYQDRLKLVGCEKITYLTAAEKVPLSIKWVKMSYEAAPTSEYYIMWPSDDYHHPYTLIDSEKAVKYCDYFVLTQGYFYEFGSNKIIQYSQPGRIGLQTMARTSLVQKLPLEIRNKAVNGWFYYRLPPIKVLRDTSDHWKGSLYTTGYNNISIYRHSYFTDVRRPFYPTTEKLENIVPEDICKRLIEL